jgi:regulator of PEP synthase PpsR (kinase-PPPase family)
LPKTQPSISLYSQSGFRSISILSRASNIKKNGAQHVLDKDYFRRIDAMNFTMAHDDGVLPDDLDDADIILLGISRTSKTPTSII